MESATKECLERTDTFVNCVRAQSSDNFNCSNIGIACQPKDVICVRRADDKTKDAVLNTQLFSD
jgi:hypothetical protein